MLSLGYRLPDKVAHVLPHASMAAQALKDAVSVLVGRGWQRSEEERDHRGVRFSNLSGPFDKSFARTSNQIYDFVAFTSVFRINAIPFNSVRAATGTKSAMQSQPSNYFI